MTLDSRRSIAFCLVLLIGLPAGIPPASATCGGGGGGGMGGATSSGGAPLVYRVPWKVMSPGAGAPDGFLVAYWFPISPESVKGADLLTSRYLALSSAQCVGFALVPNDNEALRGKYGAPAGEPVVVLADKEGTEIGRAKAESGKMRAESVETLLKREIERREGEAKTSLETAGKKLDQNDAAGAEAIYTHVWEQRCLLPNPAKKAAKALKKLGKPVPEEESSRLETNGPLLSEPISSQIVRTMKAGLKAEWDGKILDAKRLYSEAGRMDPADPVPACFLGELLRHHTGEWVAARSTFERVLAMRADPVSRAVSLHGLGKMTIHDGDFAKGLTLFEESLGAYPLALTYRNLAVYWNSEKNRERAYEFVKKAIALDPDDEYTQIFAATYLAELGHTQEAEDVAKKHERVLAASYNLAVIYAHAGNKPKTLELLRRHFFVYEQFDAVRRKEMQEARDDIAFSRYHKDPDFVKLTALADKDDTSYHRKGV